VHARPAASYAARSGGASRVTRCAYVAAARDARRLVVDAARRVEPVEAVVVVGRVARFAAVVARHGDEAREGLVRERMRLSVRGRGGDVRRARAARRVVAEALRVAAVRLARRAAVRRNVSRSFHEAAHPPVALHEVTCRARRHEVGRVERPHEAAAFWPRQSLWPDAQAREAVALVRSRHSACDAALAHHRGRGALRDRKRHVLLRCHALVRPDACDNGKDPRFLAAPAAALFIFEQPAAPAAAQRFVCSSRGLGHVGGLRRDGGRLLLPLARGEEACERRLQGGVARAAASKAEDLDRVAIFALLAQALLSRRGGLPSWHLSNHRAPPAQRGCVLPTRRQAQAQRLVVDARWAWPGPRQGPGWGLLPAR
jgi:hypothetical protein